MADSDRVHGIGKPSGGGCINDCSLRDGAGTNLTRSAQENPLGIVPGGFTRYSCRPPIGLSRISPPLPPWRILTGGVHGEFKSCSPGLTHLVCRHEKALPIGAAGFMELSLLRIRAIVS